MTLEQKADRNIKLIVIAKIFGKRVFLPLSAIYFMQVAGFSFAGIGLLGSLYFAVNFICDVPTGIFADRIGRKSSIKVGAALNICSTLLYVLEPTKTGVIIGTILEAIGYAFIVGAGEALIHDSLEVKNKVNDYTKVMSRAQSISLVINAGLVALVPMTYKIDPRLPFLIGTFAYLTLFITASFMHEVIVGSKHKFKHTVLPMLKSSGMLLFALFYGVFGALYMAPSDQINLAFKNLGLQPQLIGWVFASASIFGALVGVYFHKLKLLSIDRFILIDIACVVLPFISIFLGSLHILIFGTLFSMAMFRYRRGLYQDKMLEHFPGRPKATLISMLNNFEGIHLIWIPAALGFTITKVGYQEGFGILTIFTLITGSGFIFAANRLFTKPKVKSL